MKQHPALSMSGLSRRAALGTAVGAALSLRQRGRAAAQAATPAATPVSRDGHPIIGEWRFGGGHLPFVSDSYHVDGTAIAYDPNLGIGIGRWRATGERIGEIILVYQHLEGYRDPTTLDETMFAPDYVSSGHEFVPGGWIQRWTSVEVDEGGTTMTVKGSFEERTPDGSLGALFGGVELTATRFVPAATGTPTA